MRKYQLSHRTVSLKKAQEPYNQVFQQIALILAPNQPTQTINQQLLFTYLEPCETKVTYFDLTIPVNKDVVTFDVSMDNAQLMHVEEGPCRVKSDL